MDDVYFGFNDNIKYNSTDVAVLQFNYNDILKTALIIVSLIKNTHKQSSYRTFATKQSNVKHFSCIGYELFLKTGSIVLYSYMNNAVNRWVDFAPACTA